jgi:hypothetical protein
MAADRRRRLVELLANGADSEPSLLARICNLTVTEVGVSGAGVTLLSRPRDAARQHLAVASDALVVRLEELTLTVGEGPALRAAVSEAPVLVPNVAAAVDRWPAFVPGALALGVAAVFSFPLQVGVIRLGSLDCYRSSAGDLNETQLVDALLLADLCLEAALAEVAGHAANDLGWIADVHAVVHQASGVVMAQLGVSIEAALLRLRAYAFAHDLPLAEVSRHVIDGRIRLESDT